MQDEDRKPSEVDAQPDADMKERQSNTPEAGEIAELDKDRSKAGPADAGDQPTLTPKDDEPGR